MGSHKSANFVWISGCQGGGGGSIMLTSTKQNLQNAQNACRMQGLELTKGARSFEIPDTFTNEPDPFIKENNSCRKITASKIYIKFESEGVRRSSKFSGKFRECPRHPDAAAVCHITTESADKLRLLPSLPNCFLISAHLTIMFLYSLYSNGQISSFIRIQEVTEMDLKIWDTALSSHMHHFRGKERPIVLVSREFSICGWVVSWSVHNWSACYFTLFT